MQTLYPAGPASVPQRLTEPSANYRRHAWLAMLGLLAFIVVYFGMLCWFVWTAYRLVAGLLVGGGDDALVSLIAAACAAFLAVFMIKALFFSKRAHDGNRDIELDPAQQPELFAFLHRLADEAGAPRPRRVYLSAHVNAGVFYDLSLANLVFPSQKNLEIGLGLVNVLSLGELKAVLAHEFGHFAQRTMAVGRWVYIAQQIAGHIVAKRDALDSFLSGLSRVDVRIAWIGWLLSLIVWSIRSLVEMIFRGVVLAQRALSREMEYQADLVAASLTGSDALVHALHRLGAADEAWNRAIQFASEEAAQDRPVKDLFAVQLRIIDHMRAVLADPDYGRPPQLPGERQESHRVFRAALAQPPQMWSTHPSNQDREASIKRVYIPCGIDDRSALELLRDAQALKEETTRRMLTGPEPAFAPIEESLQRVDEQFAMRSLSRRYRGTYLGRSIVRGHARSTDLYPQFPIGGDPVAQLDALYSSEHGERIESLRELEQQRSVLEAISKGDMKAAGGVVQWRGAQIPRKSLPAVLAELDAEIAPLREAVETHDRHCRGLHLAAAERLGPAWASRLRGQLEVLHYAEHVKADVLDAFGLLHNTYQIVTADRKVSSSELRRLLAACNQVYDAIASVHDGAPQVTLDERIAEHLGAERWSDLLPERFAMSRATEDNINSWMNVVDGWVKATVGPLSTLRHAALESLLATEDEVAQRLRDATAAEQPQRISAVPREYVTLLPGAGRALQKKLGWWDRFQTADGWLPGIARVAVAGGIVGAVFTVGGSVGLSKISVYNGLARSVVVQVDAESATVEPFSFVTLSIPNTTMHHVETRTADSSEIIESFDTDVSAGTPHLVYNVASAAPLVEWTAVYGSVQPQPETRLGAERWRETSAQDVFVDPPESISSSGEGGSRQVISAISNRPPAGMLSALSDGDTRSAMRMAEAHARWDVVDGHLAEWMMRAKDGGNLPDILAARLKRNPAEVVSLRIEQDTTEGAQHDAVCARHRAVAAKPGAKPALQYVALRCVEDNAARNVALIEAHARWPDESWLVLAAGYVHAERAQWDRALPLLEKAASIPEAAAWIIPDVARLKRGAGTGTPQVLQSLASRSGYLEMLLALESGTGTEGSPAVAYRHLATGDLNQALKVAESEPGMLPQLLPLAAASDGADAETIRRALALPAATDRDSVGAWMLLALTARTGGDVAALRRAAVASEKEEGAALAAFFDAVRSGADSRAAEAALGEVSPRGRGIAYASAVVLLGARCPEQWREQAKWLLFAAERPYFA
jgi:Zn-dependent protease with chaperone function